jgi:hypothetical protein
MDPNPSGEKIDTVKTIESLHRVTVSLQKRMEVLYAHRKELLARYKSVNSLDNRFRKQLTEILVLFTRNRGKDYDFLYDESYDFVRVELLESKIKMHEARAAHGGSSQLTSDQLLEEEELYVKIEEMVTTREKVLRLREEFYAQEEAANARIEELLKIIGK